MKNFDCDAVPKSSMQRMGTRENQARYIRKNEKSGKHMKGNVFMFKITGWSHGFGDPTFIGWFTFFAYIVTAALCFKAYMHCRRQLLPITASDKRRKPVSCWIWLGLFLAFLFLGINKQLDLQTLFMSPPI